MATKIPTSLQKNTPPEVKPQAKAQGSAPVSGYTEKRTNELKSGDVAYIKRGTPILKELSKIEAESPNKIKISRFVTVDMVRTGMSNEASKIARVTFYESNPSVSTAFGRGAGAGEYGKTGSIGYPVLTEAKYNALHDIPVSDLETVADKFNTPNPQVAGAFKTEKQHKMVACDFDFIPKQVSESGLVGKTCKKCIRPDSYYNSEVIPATFNSYINLVNQHIKSDSKDTLLLKLSCSIEMFNPKPEDVNEKWNVESKQLDMRSTTECSDIIFAIYYYNPGMYRGMIIKPISEDAIKLFLLQEWGFMTKTTTKDIQDFQRLFYDGLHSIPWEDSNVFKAYRDFLPPTACFFNYELKQLEGIVEKLIMMGYGFIKFEPGESLRKHIELIIRPIDTNILTNAYGNTRKSF